MKYGMGLLLAMIAVAAVVLLTVDGALMIVYGWVPFLARVIPQVTVDLPSAIVGVTAFTLFLAGVHLTGRRIRPQTWKLRWTVAAVLGVVILFASGISFVGMIHQVAWLSTSEEPIVQQTVVRRQYPVNSLRQMGWAIQTVSDFDNALPSGGTYSPSGLPLHSWETQMLPFMTYSTYGIDMTRPWNDSLNQKYFKCVLPDFINADFRVAKIEDAEGYGLSHYAANQRVMGANSRMSLADITDGTGNTILVGEVNANFQPWGHPVNFRDPANGLNRSPHGFGGPPGTGRVMFLMADGTVKTLSDRIDPKVLKALSTPNSRDNVPE
ncbi:hypothetical protein BH11PLA2_BH11PLA2_17180 [soil metagenome]